MKFKLNLLALTALFFVSFNAIGAGWSGYGRITEINQQPASGSVADVVIVTDISSNPTTCTITNQFLFDVDTDRDKRLFSTLLAAFMAGKEVRLFVTDGCPVWNMPKVTGVIVR